MNRSYGALELGVTSTGLSREPPVPSTSTLWSAGSTLVRRRLVMTAPSRRIKPVETPKAIEPVEGAAMAEAELFSVHVLLLPVLLLSLNSFITVR